MKQYIDLLRTVMDYGDVKDQRATLEDGSRPLVKSIFGAQMRFDLQQGFPLVTTKRMSFYIVFKELMWMLSGSTNVKPLQDACVKIWDEWADEDGDLGPVYGAQWRRFGSDFILGGVDQIGYVIDGINAVKKDPHSSLARRLVMTAWNPIDHVLHFGNSKAPMACHTMAQFNVTKGLLSCHMYQRSGDMFLGVPYNIASYALLTHLLADFCGLGVGHLIHSLGDAHVYENHFAQVAEQIERKPRPLPTLERKESSRPKSIEAYCFEDFHLEGYKSHPLLKGKVAI